MIDDQSTPDPNDPTAEPNQPAGIAIPIRAAIAIGVVLVVVIAGVVGWKVVHTDALPDGAVLKVGDHTVTKVEFNRRISVLEALYGVKAPTAGSKVSKFRRDAAKSMAVSLLMSDAAAGKGVVVPEKKAQDALAKIIDQQIPTGQAGFTQFLERTQVTEADVLEEVRLQLLTSLLFDKITADVPQVTDQDVKKAYDDGKGDLVTPERRRVSNIVVATKGEAEHALQRIRAGESFAAVAKSASLDGSSRAKGGDLGLVAQDELLPAYGKAVFAAKVGAFFGPVQTEYGWNVGQVTSVAAPQQLTYDEVKARLKARLQDEARYKVWRTWLAKQIKNANVHYADAYRPDHPDAPPSDAASPAS